MPNLAVFKRYLANDLDYSRSQSVEQVMGAFFLIPHKIINQVGLLDEIFFIWFEEVDYCQRVKQAGHQVYYFNQAQIIHHFGQSFKQRLSLDKQKIFNQSLSYYFKKHHSKLEYIIINLLRPVSLALAGLSQIFNFKQ
jgi:hypothetical protein